MGRSARQVAERAMILSTVAFRGSLEVTEHPRAAEICGRLLGWLHEVGCGDEVDPIERDLLATPHKRLGPSLRMDTNSAGEKGAVFCWMLGVVGPLEVERRADESQTPWFNYVLREEAMGVMEAATLRDGAEIEEACRQFVLIKTMLRELRVEGRVREVIRRSGERDLEAVGVKVTEGAVERAAGVVRGMSFEVREAAAGIYFVRALAAMWFLDGGGG